MAECVWRPEGRSGEAAEGAGDRDAAVEHVKAYVATDLVDKVRDALSKFADFAVGVLNLMKGGCWTGPKGSA